MNKLLIVLVFAFATCKMSDTQIYTEFKNFIKKYDRKYASSEEYMARFRVFKKNIRRVEFRHKKYLGITRFMDLTPTEFQRKYLALNTDVTKTIPVKKYKPMKLTAPDEWDWEKEGAVSQVKDQASCGSCWAFSATGNLESSLYISEKKSLLLSEQQLVDCDTKDAGKYIYY